MGTSSDETIPDDMCQICGRPREGHEFHHPFSGAGQDAELKVLKKEPRPVHQVISAAPDAMMLRLLRILSGKGVIDGDDIASIIGIEPRPIGDGSADRSGGLPEDAGRGSRPLGGKHADRAPEQKQHPSE